MNAPRLAIVHIGKTGGTALKNALVHNFEIPEVCPFQFEHQYPEDPSTLTQYRFFNSHMGYDVAKRIGVPMATVLRDPFDRIVSLYYFWRESKSESAGPSIAKRFTLEEILEGKAGKSFEPGFKNPQTWQLATGYRQTDRAKNISDDDLLRMAKENLETFAAVGVTEALPQVCAQVERSVGLKPKPLAERNKTKNRPSMDDISASLRRQLHEWVYLDVALYQHVLKRFVLA